MNVSEVYYRAPVEDFSAVRLWEGEQVREERRVAREQPLINAEPKSGCRQDHVRVGKAALCVSPDARRRQRRRATTQT